MLPRVFATATTLVITALLAGTAATPASAEVRVSHEAKISLKGFKFAAVKYKTKKATGLYSRAGGKKAKKLTAVPKAYVLGSASRKVSGGWYEVEYLGKTGWVRASDVSKTSVYADLGATSASYTNATYANAIKGVIRQYCPGASVKVTNKRNDPNPFSASNYPMRITINRFDAPDPLQPSMKSIALHECAHLIQYTTYGMHKPATSRAGYNALLKSSKRIWPKGDSLEHMADCMSDAMGGKRTGLDFTETMYEVGYGAGCTSSQVKAAKKVLSGKRI